MKINGKGRIGAVDVLTPYSIRITKKHISGATRKCHYNCPVSRYFKIEGYNGQKLAPHSKNNPSVETSISRIMLRVGTKDNYTWYRYLLPRHILQELIAFDKGAPFEPGEYTLGAVKPRTYSAESYKKAKESKQSGKVRVIHRTKNVRDSIQFGWK